MKNMPKIRHHGEKDNEEKIYDLKIEICKRLIEYGMDAESAAKNVGVNYHDLSLELKYGDTLPRGYMIQSEPINDQTQADRDARKAPPIYVSLKLAGAIHHVTVQIDVNR